MADGLVVGSYFPSFVGASEIGGPVAASNGGFVRYVLDRTRFGPLLGSLSKDLIAFYPFIDDDQARPLDLVTGRRLNAWSNQSRSNNTPILRSTGTAYNVSVNNTQFANQGLFSTPTASNHGTVAMWVKMIQDDSNLLPLVLLGASTTDAIFMGPFNGTFCIGANSPGFGVLDVIATNALYVIGQWHHVAWAADDSGGTRWRIWVDGVEQPLNTVLGSNNGYWAGILDQLGFSPVDFTLARQADAPNNDIFSFSDIGIWNRVLTDAEIRRLAQEPDSLYDFRVRRVNLDYFRRHIQGIPSVEAFGTPAVQLQINPTGIAATAALGTPSVTQQIVPTGIASASAFGTAKVQLQINPTGIASTSAFGTPTLTQQILATGIASASAFGTAQVQLQINPTGVPTAEAFGTPTLTQQILATGIASTSAVGTPSVQLQVNPTGIPSVEAFGTPTIQLQIQPTGIPTAEAFGTPNLSPRIVVTSIGSAEAFGNASITQQIVAVGIPTAEVFGAPSVQLQIQPTGIPSATVFGLPFFGNGVSGPIPNLDVAVVSRNMAVSLASTDLDVILTETNLDVSMAQAALSLNIPATNLNLSLTDPNLDITVNGRS